MKEQKCKKGIEQDISNNGAKMCVCHKSVLKSGMASSFKIWDLIWDLLLEDLRLQRKQGF